MMGIRNEIRLREDVVQPFLAHLDKGGRFHVIATGSNSFEGWLKWELAAFCATEVFRLEEIDPVKMGVEAKELLSQVKYQDKDSKLVDFWIATVPGVSNPPYHLLELKVVFDNQHAGKMANSAGHDFWYLSTLREEVRARTIGVLAFVQGWEDADVRRFKEQIEGAMGSVPYRLATSTVLGRSRRWTALYYEQDWQTARRAHSNELKSP